MARAKKAAKKTVAQHDAGDAGALREEQIRLRAYERYLARGGTPGHDVEDWLQAELDLERERQ